MTAPSVPTAVWLIGAFDPILIAVAVFLGWKADQFGKVFIAAIAALAVSVLAAWLITLVGLVAKNGILIVQFANHLQETGVAKLAAVIEASATRLRPILMTSAIDRRIRRVAPSRSGIRGTA